MSKFIQFLVAGLLFSVTQVNAASLFDAVTLTQGSLNFIGWACDPSNPDSQPQIDVWIDGQYLGGQPANINREQAVATACSSAHSAHGFNFTAAVPPGLMDDKSHQIHAYMILPSGESELSASPLNIFLSALPVPPIEVKLSSSSVKSSVRSSAVSSRMTSSVLSSAVSSRMTSSVRSSAVSSRMISSVRSSVVSSIIKSSVRSSPVSSSIKSSVRSSAVSSRMTSSVRSSAVSSRMMSSVRSSVVSSIIESSVRSSPVSSSIKSSVRSTAISSSMNSSVRSSALSSSMNSSFRSTAVSSGISSSVRSSVVSSSIKSSVRSSALSSSMNSSFKSSAVSSGISSSVRSSAVSSAVTSSVRSSVVSSSLKSSVRSSAASSININADRSLLVHDVATLQASDFSLRSTLQQLVNQLNVSNPANQTNVEQLFSRMWDTQNPTPGHVQGGEKCTQVLNGFPLECRPEEGSQADNPVFFVADYIPIALINRFDLRDNVTFNDCGEYRIIYAMQSGGRNFIIFEAQMPNPNPGVAAGCLPIAQFWQNLSAQNNDSLRATALRSFYFTGLPAANVPAVIDIRNYAAATGQVRTNMFMGSSWVLKEFKVGVDGQGLKVIKPASVKSNPVDVLFDGNRSDPQALAFQADFVANMDSLLGDETTFTLTVANDSHNNGQSHADGEQHVSNIFPPATENKYLEQFGININPFQQNVVNKLASTGSNLDSAQIMNRATAMTCGGCHQPETFGLTSPNAIGPNQSWPTTLGFVHVSEFVDNGVFPLSPALTEKFLPSRLNDFKSYLANPSVANQRDVLSPSSAVKSTPVIKFNKRAG